MDQTISTAKSGLGLGAGNSLDATVVQKIRVRVAQALAKEDRQRGLAALNKLFEAGRPPEPTLDGYYKWWWGREAWHVVAYFSLRAAVEQWW